MSDIAERLRKWRPQANYKRGGPTDEMFKEAADEIDRLRAALEEIASDPTGTSIYQAEIAKTALQPKEGGK